MNKIKLMGENIIMGFDLIWPVGVAYPQYPGFPSPMDLWGEFSTWEVVKYGGAFFRTEGGNAKDFLSPMPVTTSDGLEFTVDWTSIVHDEQEKFRMEKNFNIGDFVAIDGEFREIKEVLDTGTWKSAALSEGGSWGSIQGFKVDAAFTEPSGGYQNITKVWDLQKDTFQGHKHVINGVQRNHNGASDDYSNIYPGIAYTTDIVTDNINGTPRYGKETRSINSTFKIWKRIS